jgi:glycogen debranching enzyme
MSDHQQAAAVAAAEKKYGPKTSRASRVRSISGAVVAKDGDLYFLCEPDGRVPLGGSHGFGLYYHDCRFLDGYELSLAGSRPSALMATGRAGFEADLVLTNSDLRMADGSDLQKEDVGITWERVLDGQAPALHDAITLRNYTLRTVEFPLSLSFAAAFEDVFQVRGLPATARGQLHPPRWQGGALVFAYDGSDGLHRTLTVHFDPAPARADGTTAYFQVRLRPQAEQRLLVTLAVAESRQAAAPRPAPADFDGWLGRQTQVRTDAGLLEAAAQFHAYRLPEVFAGFDKDQYGVPVHYPVACHPQAWAAGSVPYLLTALLGLGPDGFAKRLRVVRPVLPDGANELELHGLRVGAARADLRFERAGGPRATVKVLKVEGPLDVVVDESPLA